MNAHKLMIRPSWKAAEFKLKLEESCSPWKLFLKDAIAKQIPSWHELPVFPAGQRHCPVMWSHGAPPHSQVRRQ